MTAPDPIDIDHIDALYAAASVPMSFQGGKAAAEQRAAVLDAVFDFGNAMDAAWPAISAELRRLRAELRRMAEWYDAIADTIPGDAAGPHFGVVEWVRQLVANARALAIEELECLIRDDATWISDTEVVRVRGIRERIAALRAGDAAKETARVQQARREGFEAGLDELEREKLRANNNSNNNNKEDGK